MICQRRDCPECGDRLIHQSSRGPDESSSAFGQFVHDNISRVMYWLDIDGAIFKSSTRMLRVIEHKPVAGRLSDSQNVTLPLFAKAIQLLAATGLVHHESGVFIIYSDHPYDSGSVRQIEGWSSRGKGLQSVLLTGDIWQRFLEGEPISLKITSANQGRDLVNAMVPARGHVRHQRESSSGGQ